MKISKSLILFLIFIIFVAIVFIWFAEAKELLGFGDETYYVLAAKTIVENNFIIPKSIPKMYEVGNCTGEYLSKPPLVYYIPAIFLALGKEAGFRLVAPFFAILSIILVYFIGRDLFDEWIGLLAGITMAGVPLFIHFSIITYMETFTVFIFLLAIYAIYKAITLKTRKWTIIAGVCYGLALLTKEIAIFFILAFIFYLIFMKFKKEFDKKEFKILLIILMIGFLIYTPWLIRNYLEFNNPVFPLYPETFGYKYIDITGLQLRRGLASTPISYFLDSRLLSSYFGIMFFFSFFGIAYLLTKRRKLDLFLITFIIILILPIIFIGPLRDIRYIYMEIPILALAIAFFIRELYKNKELKIISIVIIAIIILLSLFTIFTESKRVSGEFGPPIPTQKEMYAWVITNTPEDAVFYTLFTPNFVYYTNRTGTYTHPFVAGELYHFWNKPESEALTLLKKYDIDYVLVEGYNLLRVSGEYGGFWDLIGYDFIVNTANWDSFEIVFNNEYILISKITYP